MIGFLSGTIELRNDPCVIVNVSGVGYKVLVSPQILKNEKLLGQQIKLYVYTHVREDILELYGFAKKDELKLFEQLISVSGVGPKTALGVFSLGTSEEIENAIALGNVDFFAPVPRLGKKNAQKIIIELKNKLGSSVELDLSGKDAKENKDVIEALKSFGFSAKEAGEAVRALDKSLKPEEKIRQALKYLGK